MTKRLVLIGSNRKWGRDFAWSERFVESVQIMQFSSVGELEDLLDANASPDWIFFTFWSSYISKDIYAKHRSVIFHMTDLPYGRGGSPLQNLILAGHKRTMLTAISCAEKMDAGDVYLKRDLDLSGTAQDIYLRASTLMPSMIESIVLDRPIPKRQTGEVIEFRRRTPEQSRVQQVRHLEDLFDFIRMLDAEGYPRAFLTLGNLSLTFENPTLIDEKLFAQVVIELIEEK